MNRRQLEVQKSHIQDEKTVLKQLKACYQKASDDCVKKIQELASRTDMENLQSIVYQIQYQKALKKQLDSILDTLQAESFTTLTEYLTKCYDNGYIGAMYDLQGQGIPLILPIDQASVVKALQNDAKLVKPYYDRLGEDVAFLKKAVKAQVSRGIANGSSWFQVAQELANKMVSPFSTALYNSMRIARTEGHRIQQQSQWDALNKAKDKGADIVKQWDSTLDNRTRETHRLLDGQIRELDEQFEVNGHKAKFPGAFGIPEEDIHCRCCMLQRARWAMDEDELHTLEEKAKFFGLDKTADFEEYRKKFKIASQTIAGHPNCPLATSYGDTFYSDLRKRVADCKDPDAVAAWELYEEKIKVGDPNYKGRAYAQAGRVYLDKSVTMKGSSYQNPYQVAFHESGHAIDFMARQKGNGYGYFFSSTYEHGKFPATIKSEIGAYVSALDKQLKADFKAHKTDYEWLHQHGYISDWNYSFWKSQGSWIGGEPKYSKAHAYSVFEKEIRAIPMIARGNISDIAEGATKGKVSGGIGHGASYWKGSDENLGTEAFAEMLDATFANPESLEQIKKYLPDSYKVFQEMLAELAKG